MRPYKNIKIGDIYQRYPGSLEYIVTDKCDEEKMIELQGISSTSNYISTKFWKSNRDSLFNRMIFENENS
jgi:hypothetical protein